MKTKLVKSIMAPLVVACALLTMVAATASGQGTQGGQLQGTWEMQITLTDCAGHVIRSFPSLIEFAAGGTVVESNGGTPQALKTPGEGVWRHATDNNYAFRFKFFTFNPLERLYGLDDHCGGNSRGFDRKRQYGVRNRQGL